MSLFGSCIAVATDGSNAGISPPRGEVLSRCRAWAPAEHLTLFNVELGDIDDVQMLLRRGRRLLSAIPGGRQVSAGYATADGAKYRFLWRVVLANPDAQAAFIGHANYRDFTQRLMPAISEDRVMTFFHQLDTVPLSGEGLAMVGNWG